MNQLNCRLLKYLWANVGVRRRCVFARETHQAQRKQIKPGLMVGFVGAPDEDQEEEEVVAEGVRKSVESGGCWSEMGVRFKSRISVFAMDERRTWDGCSRARKQAESRWYFWFSFKKLTNPFGVVAFNMAASGSWLSRCDTNMVDKVCA